MCITFTSFVGVKDHTRNIGYCPIIAYFINLISRILVGHTMARPRGLIEVVCQNPNCDYFRKEEGKDIIKRGSDARTGHQRYYCNYCRKFFMETKGTPLFNKKLKENEIINICKHFVEKNGIRSIERITGHHRDTIGNLLTDIAEHAKQMNEFLIQNVGLSTIECDEFWTFVKKNKRKLSAQAQKQISQAMHGSLPVL